MPETWIPKAGPTQDELNLHYFNEWWNGRYTEWLHDWSKKDVQRAKEIAWAAWEHQRKRCAVLVKDIIDTIKESTP